MMECAGSSYKLPFETAQLHRYSIIAVTVKVERDPRAAPLDIVRSIHNAFASARRAD